MPNGPGFPHQRISLPGRVVLTLEGKATGRLWRARLSAAVVPYLLRHGIPIMYFYVQREWGCRATRRCAPAAAVTLIG